MTSFKPLTVGLLAGFIATAAIAAEPVSKVDVTTDLTAIKNEKAAAYWGNLDTDLEAAIIGRLTDRLVDKDGAEITVDVNEIELANAYERELNLADAVLTGAVEFKYPSPEGTDRPSPDNRKFDLQVSLKNANIVLKEGETLHLSMTDTPETYQRLVDTFAAEIVQRLE